jgi:hypothetical protein
MENSFRNNLIYIFGIGLLFMFFIIVGYFMHQRNKKNGATLAQQYVGKKIGELCTGNAMCGSNKCVNNVCVW